MYIYFIQSSVLPHVLEVYDIPPKFSVKDVKGALVAKDINAEVKVSSGFRSVIE